MQDWEIAFHKEYLGQQRIHWDGKDGYEVVLKDGEIHNVVVEDVLQYSVSNELLVLMFENKEYWVIGTINESPGCSCDKDSISWISVVFKDGSKEMETLEIW